MDERMSASEEVAEQLTLAIRHWFERMHEAIRMHKVNKTAFQSMQQRGIELKPAPIMDAKVDEDAFWNRMKQEFMPK